MNSLQDIFISYSRADSKHFAKTLSDRLVNLGYTVWLNFEDTPLRPLEIDPKQHIENGIEKADNFLFVISPHSVNSSYCDLEVEFALKRKKRIIPLLYMEQIDRDTWHQCNPNGTDEQWTEYQAAGKHSSFSNIHSEISNTNWVYFREGLDDFERALQELRSLLEFEKNYVHQHTMLLNCALKWERNQKQTQYLLTGQNRQLAEKWLAIRFIDEKPPVWPTDLHYEYITESIKNGQNLMNQVFLSYAEEDIAITEKVWRSLTRAGITTWSYRVDVEHGRDFEVTIARGIEQADNVLFLMSSHSLNSAYCQQELTQALQLNKRLIIMLVGQVKDAKIPVFLRNRHYIDLRDDGVGTKTDYLKNEDDLLQVLNQDATYYNEHKVLLTKALKWKWQQRNPCLLLQGYELQRAVMWREIANTRHENGPIALQYEFIEASQSQSAVVLPDIFISYSHVDSDFVRQLNNALQKQQKRTWFDQERMISGTNFQQERYQGIATSKLFLFVLSPQTVKSQYCADEIEYAAKLNKQIVVVLHHSVNLADLHPELTKGQWIDFAAHDEKFDHNFQELLQVLDTNPEQLRNPTSLSARTTEREKMETQQDGLPWRNNLDLEEAEQWLLTAAGKRFMLPEVQDENALANRRLTQTTGQKATRQQRKQILNSLSKVAIAGIVAIAGGALAMQKPISTQKVREQREPNRMQLAGLHSLKLPQQLPKTQVLVPKTEDQHLDTWAEAIQTDPIPPKNEAVEKNETAVMEEGEAEALRKDEKNKSIRKGELDTLQQSLSKLSAVSSLDGHAGTILSASFSPNGKMVVSGSYDQTIKLWDAKTGKEIHSFSGHNGSITSVNFSPDSRTVVSGSDDQTIKLWDVVTGKEIQSFSGHDGFITSVNFSPDGKTVISGSYDQTAKLWDVGKGKEIRTFSGHDGFITSVNLSPDGKTLISGSYDQTAKLWDVETGEEIGSLRGHNGSIASVSFSPDGKTVISGSNDQTVKLWDVETRKKIHNFSGHDGFITSVSFSPDGKTVVSGSYDQTAKLWDVETGQEIQSFWGHDGFIASVSFSPDGKTVISGSYDQTAKLWDVETGEEMQSLRSHNDFIASVSSNPNDPPSDKAVVSDSSDSTDKIQD